MVEETPHPERWGRFAPGAPEGPDVKKFCTPLFLAAQLKPEAVAVAVCEVLLEFGASVDMLTAGDASTPLWNAVQAGNASVVAVLLANGANADADVDKCEWKIHVWEAGIVGGNNTGYSVDGWHYIDQLVHENSVVSRVRTTPLLTAAEKGQPRIVELLLERGATVDKPADDGSTAFSVATRCGHAEVVRLLQKAGAREDIVHRPFERKLLSTKRGGRLEGWLDGFTPGRSTALYYRKPWTPWALFLHDEHYDRWKSDYDEQRSAKCDFKEARPSDDHLLWSSLSDGKKEAYEARARELNAEWDAEHSDAIAAGARAEAEWEARRALAREREQAKRAEAKKTHEEDKRKAVIAFIEVFTGLVQSVERRDGGVTARLEVAVEDSEVVDHFQLRQYGGTGDTTVCDWWSTSRCTSGRDKPGLCELRLFRNKPEQLLPAPCGKCWTCKYVEDGECEHPIAVDMSHKAVVRRSGRLLFAAPLGVFSRFSVGELKCIHARFSCLRYFVRAANGA